ncbi:MAG: hypothetical protein IJQ45_03690 [Clostridia bacterium]|nr:hypothetical protein [Clostridia bacterium]
MGIKCPNCGGGMVFDVAKQKLVCPYCDNVCTVDAYRQNNAAEYVNDNYIVSSYRCKNCGAELTAPEEQTVAYCSYCGGEAMLKQKETETVRPKRIIPFQRTKKEAIRAYENAVKKVLYVPKELKDASFLEGFRGVYLPYWGIDVEIPPKELNLKGSRSYTQGKYDYYETYDVTAQIGGQVEGAVYDASAAFDDTLAAEIAPFDQKGAKPFDEGYLAGFYADKVTASPQVYKALAAEQAADKVFDSIQREAGKVTVSLPASKEKRIETVGAKVMGETVSLFPVWFLTWRRNDRVAYSVMNGQSGKITMDLPVDHKQFFLYSAIAALVLFLVLSLMPAFIQPMTMAALCAVLLVLSGRILNGELKKIRLQEQHVYDYGYDPKKKKGKPKAMTSSCLTGALGYVLFGILAALAFTTTTGSDGTVGPVFFLALIAQIVLSVKLMRNAAGMNNKSGMLPAMAAPVILILGSYVGVNPEVFPNDAWYYALAIGCLVGMLINILFAIGRYNDLATRPVPNFFRREGANNAQP